MVVSMYDSPRKCQDQIMGRNRSPQRSLLLAGGIALASLILVALSPFALQAIASLGGINWQKLSNVGQTYGAMSALLAALALVGVAVSVSLQVRQSYHSRVQAADQRHHELMRLALDDPRFGEFWISPGASYDSTRQIIYTNLLLQFWETLWEFDDMSEMILRKDIAAMLFGAELGRTYWAIYGEGRLANQRRSKRERRFNEILDEEYRQALALGAPPKSGGDQAALSARPAIVVRVGVALTLAVATGAVLDRLINRNGRH
jgi:hypothetical protein